MIALLVVVALQGGQVPSPQRITLVQAVDQALKSHPSIDAAHAARDRARADIADARSSRLPRISLDASLNQFQEPMVVLPLHGFDPRNPPLFDRSLVQSGVSASYTLYDFGLRSARERVQDALASAAGSAMTTAERQLISRTVNAYIHVLTTRGLLAAQDERITALSSERERVQQLMTQAKAARVEQLRVDAELQRSRADRIATASQLEVAEQELAQLAQISAGAIHDAGMSLLQMPDSVYAIDTSMAVRAGLIDHAKASSSEVQELQQRVNAARAGVHAAHATGLPELRLSGAYVDRGRLKGDFAGEWQMGLAASYPLYTGGARQNAVDRASADERTATAQLRIAELNIEQGIDRTLASLREAHARAAALESAAEQSAEVMRIEKLSLDVGSGTQSDYLTAVANVLGARANLVQARHAELTARVELARLVGDLSRDWLARTVEPPR